MVTDSSGATSTNQVAITIDAVVGGDPPVAAFTYTCASATFTCYFDASASYDSDGPISYGWEFGDGSGCICGCEGDFS